MHVSSIHFDVQKKRSLAKANFVTLSPPTEGRKSLRFKRPLKKMSLETVLDATAFPSHYLSRGRKEAAFPSPRVRWEEIVILPWSLGTQ